MQRNFDDFVRECTQKLEFAQIIRQNSTQYRTLEKNRELFGGIAEDYGHSFANPEYLHDLGFPDADLLSVIYRQFDRSLRNVILNRPIFVWNKSEVLVALREYFVDFDRERLQRAYDRGCRATQIETEDSRMMESCTVINAYNAVLKSACADSLEWMSGYGVYITPLEQAMCRYWFSLPTLTLAAVAEHIVDAFFHGFISQSRAIAGRDNVRLTYAIGQEALAQRVSALFALRGMDVIVLKPSSCADSVQCAADHQHGALAFEDSQCYLGQADAYRLATDRFRPYILRTCGFVRIGTFGQQGSAIAPSRYALRASKEALALYREQMKANRDAEAALLKPDTLSFCSVVFPDMRVGAQFEEIFQAFCHLNTEDSAAYELIQQSLIDLLDTCQAVRIRGRGDNRTDLLVALRPFTDPARQSNFLNCGGDMNIPHGEIFTTPQLCGTNGRLHVSEVYLRDRYYRELSLTFTQGRVTQWDCRNFEDEAHNRDYVFENLLQATADVPMGEMAIGTNTLAYRLAGQYHLYSSLPILLAEKMGPHIAVGDPCFARGEDSPVYNLYGGKEMVARENEQTAGRHQSQDCYVNFHTDITIPYDEIGVLEGITAEGDCIPILRDGRFVPACAERLNINLR